MKNPRPPVYLTTDGKRVFVPGFPFGNVQFAVNSDRLEEKIQKVTKIHFFSSAIILPLTAYYFAHPDRIRYLAPYVFFIVVIAGLSYAIISRLIIRGLEPTQGKIVVPSTNRLVRFVSRYPRPILFGVMLYVGAVVVPDLRNAMEEKSTILISAQILSLIIYFALCLGIVRVSRRN